MEVHHHSHTTRCKWTHYFWEFLMLFLSVCCEWKRRSLDSILEQRVSTRCKKNQPYMAESRRPACPVGRLGTFEEKRPCRWHSYTGHSSFFHRAEVRYCKTNQAYGPAT